MSNSFGPRLLAFAQLIRLPNVFTAFADIALGAVIWYIPLFGDVQFRAFSWLLVATGCLYCGGMALNDWFDRRADAVTRPSRPIPSGRVRSRTALALAIGLLLVGSIVSFIGTGYLMLMSPGWVRLIGPVLAVVIVLYNGWLKQTACGPLAMGLCRFLNVLLGMTMGGFLFAGNPEGSGLEYIWYDLQIPAVVGLYVVGVTWFARTEEGESRKPQLVGAVLVMLAAGALAMVIAPVQPAPGKSSALFPYLLVAFGFYIGVPLARALRTPGPAEVQAAVKRCVLGLVALDAVLATAFVGPAGLAILLLLPPALLLGKWVYST